MIVDYNNFAINLIKTYNLNGDNRIGLLCLNNNIGDNYFFVSALTIFQKLNKISILVFTKKNSTVDKFASLHCLNDNIIHISDSEYRIICSASKNDIESFSKYIFNFNSITARNRFPDLCTWLSSDIIKRNLTRMKLQRHNDEYYIDKYKIKPGKTAFIIPNSQYTGKIQSFFWDLICGILKLVDFQILINSENANIKEDSADNPKYIYPILEDVIPICDLCGYVFSVRTGLVEMISAECKRKIYIFSKINSSITKTYPHIDNSDNHIVEYNVKKLEEFCLVKSVYNYFNKIKKPLNENLDIIKKSIFNPDSYYKPSKLEAYKYNPDESLFKISKNFKIDNFLGIKYHFDILNNYLYIILDIQPLKRYRIHFRLINKNKKDSVVCEYENFDSNLAIFNPAENGDYYLIVHITDIEIQKSVIFSTYTLNVDYSIREQIKICTSYKRYCELLFKLKEDIIIFVCSSETCTNISRKRKHELNIFKLKIDLTSIFKESYILIIDGGIIKKEISSSKEYLKEKYQFNDNFFTICSAGGNLKNYDDLESYIEFNGDCITKKGRGLIFLIFDKVNNKVLDTVIFDTYLPDCKAFR